MIYEKGLIIDNKKGVKKNPFFIENIIFISQYRIAHILQIDHLQPHQLKM